MSKERLKYGQAKVEFIACREVIVALSEAGFNIMAIYAKLRETGQVTMSPSAFYRNYQQMVLEKKRGVSNKPAATAITAVILAVKCSATKRGECGKKDNKPKVCEICMALKLCKRVQ